MIITIQIDTKKDSAEDIEKILTIINKEKVSEVLPTIAFEDLPDTGMEAPKPKAKRKAKVTEDPWEDGTLGQSLEHAKRAPQDLQDKVNAALPGAIPPPPPLPGKSEFTQMMLKITPHVVSGIMPMEKVEEFCKELGCAVNGIGTVAKMQEMPHLIPAFLEKVDAHVNSKT